MSGGSGYVGDETATVTGQNGASVTTAKFLHAHKNGYKAIEIKASDKARATDNNSIFKATVNNPVFYRESGKVYVEPGGGTIVAVSYPTINFNSTSVTGVPDDVKHLVVMGTAVKGRLYQLDSLRRSLDLLTSPSYATNNATLALVPVPTITDLSLSDPPVLGVAAPNLSVDSIISESVGPVVLGFNETAPVYEKPTLVLSSELSLDDLSITSSAPVTLESPNFSDPAISFDTLTAPTFDAPTLTTSFGNATTQIETNEDVELANAELKKISEQINEFRAKAETELHDFNEKNAEYQAEVQRLTQNAQLQQGKEFTDYANKLQKYSAELGLYQQNVNNEVQEYTVNTLQKSLTEWQSKRANELQSYQLHIQDNLNSFNEDMGNYQVKFQEAVKETDIALATTVQNAQLERDKDKQNALQEYTKDLENYRLSLQRYNTDLQKYGAGVGSKVQEYTVNKIQKDIQLWATEQSQKLQKYGADIQKESARFGSEYQLYQRDLTNIFQKHQTMVQELQMLDSQYTRGLQTFVASYREPVQNPKGA